MMALHKSASAASLAIHPVSVEITAVNKEQIASRICNRKHITNRRTTGGLSRELGRSL
ncbi:hypothetical protein RHMOL_Rhmol12G0189200 [Rhododendron molle]|uniref:Uncharacterized protein n=1 Tax=Rhododendron molle TaxID=49168 RepID=A0ACC0LKQ9_RHOML|nr:hypothetical protein RHMOL_Rhmol12G0189200 [Rhododendron molle]